MDLNHAEIVRCTDIILRWICGFIFTIFRRNFMTEISNRTTEELARGALGLGS